MVNKIYNAKTGKLNQRSRFPFYLLYMWYNNQQRRQSQETVYSLCIYFSGFFDILIIYQNRFVERKPSYSLKINLKIL
jgi:hypothetical protein